MPKIDPQTGERVEDVQIDPKTGERVNAQPSSANDGLFSSFADASGLSGLGHALMHPADTLASIPSAISSGVRAAIDNAHQEANLISTKGLTNPETRRKLAFDVPIAGPAIQRAEQQHLAGNDSGVAGTLAGTVAGLAAPKALEGLLPTAGRALFGTGEAAQDAGVGVLNKTGGMLKADFKRGANPAKAYLDAGGKPALSMAGLADNAADLQSEVGKAIPSTLAKVSTPIPAMDIAGRLQPPISRAIKLATGPGGMGDTGAIEQYAAGFRPDLQKAAVNGGLTPSEVYDMKRSIADNTTWNEANVFNSKAVKQRQVGALGGLLEDNVPGLADLNSQYSGLKNFAARTQSRAETGSSTLTSLANRHALGIGGAALGLGAGAIEHNPMAALGLGATALALDSVPVKSTLGYGLYQGGKAAQSLGRGVMSLPTPNPAAMAIPAYSLIRKKGDDANQ